MYRVHVQERRVMVYFWPRFDDGSTYLALGSITNTARDSPFKFVTSSHNS
jgi:hypothetical protein